MNPKNLYALAFVLCTQAACVGLSTANDGFDWHKEQAACYDNRVSCLRGY